jgi:4-amino-4-deoxy-L-arabinose transferase-like glycosyltransferase
MNWVFSAAAVVVFYYAARLLVNRNLARLGCAVYAAIFYAWFSGDVHSTYASQLFFPVLLFLFLMLHLRQARPTYLLGAAAAFAIGAGFRPSDGAFLGPMFVYYLVRCAPRKQALIAFALAVVLCLGWLVPSILAYRASGDLGYLAAYVANITSVASIFKNGPAQQWLANVARFVVPLATAFWLLAYPLFKSLRRIGDQPVRLLWLWIVPGACFLTLVYMSDAPYLNFLTAAALLLVLIEVDASGMAWGRLLLGCCLAWNMAFYIAFRPLPGKSLAVSVFNVYSGKYTYYGVRNQWQPNLSDIY